MTLPLPDWRDPHQAQFQLRWAGLRDTHVRSLAWLIDAPALLDGGDPAWHGQIASLPVHAGEDAASWLAQLDTEPETLHALIENRPFARLGRYAEQLMSCYFSHLGMLYAHGLQVRNGTLGTAGEFDFLLQGDGGLIHWEFATKFYLLERPDGAADTLADYFIGPNLADTLGAKMQKILGRQLALSRHPAAQNLLPEPVVQARALVKGWLFYHGRAFSAAAPASANQFPGAGVAIAHCRGFWCEAALFYADLQAAGGQQRYAILPRLAWLAPARLAHALTLDADRLRQGLLEHFSHDQMPVMVALMIEQQGSWMEARRGFIVPDDWRARAGERRRAPGLS